ncbi:MAG TPA: glutamyl-tRNA reductase [Ruania sp.]|nr:glutamyl-tRNA reductase [Ruania sp.]
MSLSHRTAGFALLERLPDASEARQLAAEVPGVRGIVPVATCNRLEFYLDVNAGGEEPHPEATVHQLPHARRRRTPESADDPGTAARAASADRATETLLNDLLAGLAENTALPVGELTEAARSMTGTRVAAHLFAVASGLDSVVLGENEIAGQVRRSLETARDEGSTTADLEQLFQMAQSTSREVKNTTALNAAGRSLVRLGLDLAASRIADWSRANIVLIGTGAYAAATWAALQNRGVQQIQVASPSGREQVFAKRDGVAPVSATGLPAALAEAELVITATRGRVLTHEQVRTARAQAGRPLLVVDLGLPANVEPQVADLPEVELLDLETISLHAPVHDLQAGSQARDLIEAATADFTRKQAIASAGPAISAYRGRVHEVLEGELERLDSRGQRSPEVERALRHFAGVLVHGPTTRSRALAAEGRLEEVTQALKVLHDLDVPTGPQSAPTPETPSTEGPAATDLGTGRGRLIS